MVEVFFKVHGAVARSVGVEAAPVEDFFGGSVGFVVGSGAIVDTLAVDGKFVTVFLVDVVQYFDTEGVYHGSLGHVVFLYKGNQTVGYPEGCFIVKIFGIYLQLPVYQNTT